MNDEEVKTPLKSNSDKLVESDIKVIGDKSTVCQLTMLIAYIRHAIQTKQCHDITVRVGSKSNSDFFGFQVNNREIKDYITQNLIEIN